MALVIQEASEKWAEGKIVKMHMQVEINFKVENNAFMYNSFDDVN
jgi:hypothetical protein